MGIFSDKASSDCAPFAESSDGKQIVPCGAIANSLFNDTLYFMDVTHHKKITLNNTGIAWPSDKKMKFKNPDGDIKKGNILLILFICSFINFVKYSFFSICETLALDQKLMGIGLQ